MASLSIEHLSTTYDRGRVKAVDDVSLDMPDGEFLVLLGASGSGKTTLMRTIAGLERPSSGTIHIDGKLANEQPPRQRNIAMVFQSYALYPHKTVAKNISFPLETVHLSATQIQEKVMWAAQLFGIERLLKRKPRELSGGERQRVALARALVRTPSLFLMDEPLSNLDAKLRHSARREFKRLHDQTGVTTLYVTHDQVEAMGLGHRVAVMNHGKIEQLGTPHEIYHEPANTFVAQFMGSPPMNLIPDSNCLLGFHAEDAWLPEGGLPAQHYPLPVEIQQIEYLGADALIYCAAIPTRTDIILRMPERLVKQLAAGQTRTFYVPDQLIRRFDAQTGQRIASDTRVPHPVQSNTGKEVPADTRSVPRAEV
ncbi:ABC transporter ATP-binding protein [Pusillimonas sp. ANT_WB101]|uniref:ABC transporter ATP-binding protein n=1 Tax=Pusillimonas sp. ANT_WB101 TaxID=2597356 RepID=UPI0011F06E07|nr:ABC transporter ATP-binding protein [Pusillimonas sp. ANT_WB101]KAA0892897.1 ABC transporter ATP-binding protein [Pusillimonas sp. ANT_WB101]